MISHSIQIVIVIALVTILIRFLPFIIFSRKTKTPPYIIWLGQVLPYAIMGMLLVYCLKHVALFTFPHGLPEYLACALVAVLHIWKREALLSIFGGTAFYMLLVQYVFK